MSKDMNEQRAKLLLRESSEDVLKNWKMIPKTPISGIPWAFPFQTKKGLMKALMPSHKGLLIHPLMQVFTSHGEGNILGCSAFGAQFPI